MNKRKRWILYVVAIFFFGFVLSEVFNPYGDKDYAEISHGNHIHYMPKDRDPNVSIDHFPTKPPGPNERILPDGKVVPK